MKRIRVPVLIEYHKIPRRYRALVQRLQRGTWTRAELRWVFAAHPTLPPLVAAVVREKMAHVKDSISGEGGHIEPRLR